MKRSGALVLAAAATIAVAAAHADGPGAYSWVDKPASATAAPQLSAIDAYNAGYSEIRRADELSSGDAPRKKEAEAAYRAALKHFSLAVKHDPLMHEAFTYIGYANRKLGRYREAMDAYETALRINPDYPHAIEYQGQAYLGLNRIEEAKFNYLRLYAISPAQANKLLSAMRDWVELQRSKNAMTEQASELSEWIATRPPITADAQSASSW